MERLFLNIPRTNPTQGHAARMEVIDCERLFWILSLTEFPWIRTFFPVRRKNLCVPDNCWHCLACYYLVTNSVNGRAIYQAHRCWEKVLSPNRFPAFHNSRVSEWEKSMLGVRRGPSGAADSWCLMMLSAKQLWGAFLGIFGSMLIFTQVSQEV